jgi:DNA-binding MarR family transcriptional regulator
MNETPPVSMTYELLSTAGEVEQRLEATLEARGLSLAKFKVLKYLHDAGEAVPLGGLAEGLSCVRSNITQLVDRLEAQKLVVRVADASDRRSVRAELTPEGRVNYEESLGILREAEKEVFGALSTAQRMMLVELLRVLRQQG